MNQDYRDQGFHDDRVRVIDVEAMDTLETVETEPLDTVAAPDESELEAERLAYDIQETRAEMSGTIGALAQKLDPPTLLDQARDKAMETAAEVVDHARESVVGAAATAVDQAKETVREATVGKVEGIMHNATHVVENAGQTAQETGRDLVRTIRENPLPAAMVGIGLWMLWQRSSSQGRQPQRSTRASDARYQQGYGAYAGGYQGYQGGSQASQGGFVQGVQSAAGTVGETAGNVASTVGQTAGNVASTVGQTAGSVASTVGQTAGTVASTVGETAGEIANRAGDVVGQVGETAAQASDQLTLALHRLRREASRALQESPLAVGATAVAAGAAIGLALPTTRQEQELLGNVRSTLVERAAETVEETAERVQEAAASGS